jgi:hypothetical protein
MSDQPFKDKNILWRWKLTREDKIKYNLCLSEIVAIQSKYVLAGCDVVLYGRYPSGIWNIIDGIEGIERIITELVYQLAEKDAEIAYMRQESRGG